MKKPRPKKKDSIASDRKGERKKITNIEKVYNYLKKVKAASPKNLISKNTGLSKAQVSNALAGLRKKKRIGLFMSYWGGFGCVQKKSYWGIFNDQEVNKNARQNKIRR